MKKAATIFAMFLFGYVLGLFIARPTFQWIASAFNALLVATSLVEPLVVRTRFALGCGVLFATAVIFSSSLRRFCLYLAVGTVVSIGTAAFYRASYAAAAADLPPDFPSVIVSLKALPALRVPLLGAIAIACLALVLYISTRRRPIQLTTNDHNA